MPCTSSEQGFFSAWIVLAMLDLKSEIVAVVSRTAQQWHLWLSEAISSRAVVKNPVDNPEGVSAVAAVSNTAWQWHLWLSEATSSRAVVRNPVDNPEAISVQVVGWGYELDEEACIWCSREYCLCPQYLQEFLEVHCFTLWSGDQRLKNIHVFAIHNYSIFLQPSWGSLDTWKDGVPHYSIHCYFHSCFLEPLEPY